jgi:hypothetical protein
LQCNGGHLPDVICRKLACNVWVINGILGHIYRRFRLFFSVFHILSIAILNVSVGSAPPCISN